MPKRQDPSSPTGLPYDFRIDRAEVQRSEADVVQPQNLDRSLMVDRAGTLYRTALFSKAFVHNSYGEVADADWIWIDVAMRSGDQEYFNRIPLNPLSVRKLIDPQAALAFLMEGADSFSVSAPPAPSMQSEVAAGEMIEVYGMALLRDESFRDIQEGTTPQEAVVTTLIDDLNSIGGSFHGPKVGGLVTRGTLFRGPNYGETVGPYVSQFLLHDFNCGNIPIEQIFNVENDTPASITTAGWLDIQNGITPAGTNPAGFGRRAYSPRVLASYVHSDPPGCAVLNAALILLGAGAPLNPGFPVLPNEEGFVTMGVGEICARVMHVAELAFKAAWRQKWVVNVRLRPEVLAGRVHFTLTDAQDYGLDPAVLTAGTTANLLAANTLAGSATYLVPLVYPEGSPPHPSYPSGHATWAGAAATVLKAFFANDTLMTSLAGGTFKIVESVTGIETMAELIADPITDPGVTGTLTVAIELNKLASNIATGRNMSGIHYREDGDQGILLGEQVAIQYLKDIAATYNQTFPGYTIRKFDGTVEIISTT
jgi:membrane-associated phospholipid phosphatase